MSVFEDLPGRLSDLRNPNLVDETITHPTPLCQRPCWFRNNLRRQPSPPVVGPPTPGLSKKSGTVGGPTGTVLSRGPIHVTLPTSTHCTERKTRGSTERVCPVPVKKEVWFSRTSCRFILFWQGTLVGLTGYLDYEYQRKLNYIFD